MTHKLYIDSKADLEESAVYQIRIHGQIGPQWTNWFDGMSITGEENGDTLITGLVIDQAALFGIIKKVRDTGMPLISVNRIHSE